MEEIKQAQEAWATMIRPFDPLRQIIDIIGQSLKVLASMAEMFQPPEMN